MALVAAVGVLVFSALTAPGGASAPGGPPRPAAANPSAAAQGASSPPVSSAPSTGPSSTTSPASPGTATPGVPFSRGLLIADRGNGRIIAVDSAGRIIWEFPAKGSLPTGVHFAADDAFVSPDGQTIVANDEYRQVIYRIDIRTRKVVWQYGHYGVPGSGPGYLHNPDDAYPLANGDVVVADIVNCRVMEIAPDHHIVRMLGRGGDCRNAPPRRFNEPNGDTPLPDGGLLITEIRGSRVVRLSPSGQVVFDIHVPLYYPSDAQLDSSGNVIVVDYHNPGSVVAVSPSGHLLWRYGPPSGTGRLNHPSLGMPLPDGTIVINDDARDRVVVLDPRTGRIVWQYGHTDISGTARGYLSDPDGNQPIPANAAF